MIAIFDLSSFVPVSDFMRKCPVTDAVIYSDDGSTKILEDRYAQPLTECNIENLIPILREEAKDTTFHGQPYRRIKPLLAMLEMFAANASQ